MWNEKLLGMYQMQKCKKQVIYSKSTFKSYSVLKIVKTSILAMLREHLYLDYCNNPKFSDRQALANSADPDQTAPRGTV